VIKETKREVLSSSVNLCEPRGGKLFGGFTSGHEFEQVGCRLKLRVCVRQTRRFHCLASERMQY